MADFASTLTAVRESLPEGTPDGVAKGLESLETQFQKMSSSLKTANSEAKDYREESTSHKELITKLESDIEGLNDKLTEAGNSGAEFESLKKFKDTTLAGQKESFVRWYQAKSGHSKFAKVKDRFDLPNFNEDGKYKWDEMTNEQLEANINSMQDLESLEYFSGPSGGLFSPPGTGSKGGQDGNIAKSGESFAQAMQRKVEERQRAEL